MYIGDTDDGSGLHHLVHEVTHSTAFSLPGAAWTWPPIDTVTAFAANRCQALPSPAPSKKSLGMRTIPLLALSVAAGCGGGGNGSLDTLPKRGERATDPTIVSASASCSGDFMFKGLVVSIDASDPAPSNLGSCAVMNGERMGQGMFVANVRCEVSFEQECVVDADYVVDLTVSNKTAGFTVASVKLHARP